MFLEQDPQKQQKMFIPIMHAPITFIIYPLESLVTWFENFIFLQSWNSHIDF